MTPTADYSFLANEGVVGVVRRNLPLAPLTKYRLGGAAEWFVCPKNLDQLSELVRACNQRSVPLRILGGGANVLVDDDGVDGVVISLESDCFTQVEWGDVEDSTGGQAASGTSKVGDGRGSTGGQAASGTNDASGTVLVRVGAGVDMARLALDSVRRGLSGLECMAGIPGSVGGCIRMNAGGRWGEISSAVRDVTVLEPSGELRTLSREQVGFSYRRSGLGKAVVCAATLELQRGNGEEIMGRYREIWATKQAAQPLAAHSAGCVFKNPPNDSAGRLIDAAGLKSRTFGGAMVSPEHANFIVAREGGTARDVLELIGIVRHTVAQKFSIDLELEIEVWRRAGKPLSPGPNGKLSGPGFSPVIPAGRTPAANLTELDMTSLARPPLAVKPGKPGIQRALAITVLSGGPSSEREVSLESGRAVAAALQSLGHKVTVCDITPEKLDALEIPADLAFIALHGAFGEDGRVQALLEGRGIRYTGSGAAASALAMDKLATKRRFAEAEVPTPKFDVITAESIDRALAEWSLPVVVKPIAEGSSIDISIIRHADKLRSELQRLTGSYGSCLLESFIDGYELTVGIIGDQALDPIEIRTKREFYDYQAKYIDDDTEYRFDIDLPPAVLAEVQTLSLRAHQALGCRHFSRVDWLVDRQTHQPYSLEINTIPGFTGHSLLPKAAARAGMSFPQLCGRIIELAYSQND